MKGADFIASPCACAECVQANVTDRELRRDPRSGAWMHGYVLKRYYDARDAFFREARAAVGAKGRHAKGFEPLVLREPGQEG